MVFEEEFTEEEINQEMLFVLGTSKNGLSEKQLIKKVYDNLEKKHLQIHLDIMEKEGLLNVNKKEGTYSLSPKAKQLKKEGKSEEYTANYAKKYHSDGTLKRKEKKK
jgi:DNA-binding IclR family transcriptional regulator